jgi:hypothetical protein
MTDAPVTFGAEFGPPGFRYEVPRQRESAYQVAE